MASDKGRLCFSFWRRLSTYIKLELLHHWCVGYLKAYHPRPAFRANNPPVAGGLANGNGPLAAEGHPDADNQNQAAGDNGNGEGENEHADDVVGRGDEANRWRGILKEIQMIVFSSISSLLPGFHNID